MTGSPEWIDQMLKPTFYPEGTTKVDLVQTHISWVFLCDEFVYKVKKPVDFGFLDFTTLEKREHFIREELRLNRRLCPEIYLECLPLQRLEDGSYALGEQGGVGEVVEWVLKMKRMPEAGMMQGMIRREEIGAGHLDRIVERLVPFYRAAATGGWVDEYGTLEKVWFNIQENFDQTRPFLGDLLDEGKFQKIVRYNHDFVEANKGLFEERIRGHMIREGHGDLYSANICFDEERGDVYCFDCIEFNERFRCGDVACDLGFLAMDLDFHGLPWFEKQLVEGFSSGYGDEKLTLLMDFYKCYRAYVRAKIGCFMANDPGLDSALREKAREDARDYFALAYRYAGGLKGVRPTVYCFMGLSGTGKSTLAKDFSKGRGIKWFNSDIIRKEVICGVPKTERHIEPFGKGIYSEEVTRKTYRSLMRHAAREVLMGRSVAIDATYVDQKERERLLGLEEFVDCKVVFIECDLDEEVLKERLKKRAESLGEPSDGRYEIYLAQKARQTPLDPEFERDRVVHIDTGGTREENLESLLGALQAKGV